MSAPFENALGKSLRQLELAYQLMLSNQVMSAEALQQSILGYEYLASDDPEARARTFERDKKDLRLLGVHFETRSLFGAEPGKADTGYRVDRARVVLPAPPAEPSEPWVALGAAKPQLQQVADALNGRKDRGAFEAAMVLLSLKRDFGLQVGAGGDAGGARDDRGAARG